MSKYKKKKNARLKEIAVFERVVLIGFDMKYLIRAQCT